MTPRLSGDWPAPTDYLEATIEEATWRKKADEAADRRAEALARMHDSGLSLGTLAKMTGLSRSRVQQLVDRGKRQE